MERCLTRCFGPGTAAEKLVEPLRGHHQRSADPRDGTAARDVELATDDSPLAAAAAEQQRIYDAAEAQRAAGEKLVVGNKRMPASGSGTVVLRSRRCSTTCRSSTQITACVARADRRNPAARQALPPAARLTRRDAWRLRLWTHVLAARLGALVPVARPRPPRPAGRAAAADRADTDVHDRDGEEDSCRQSWR